MKLKDKVAVVTGAGQGMGRAIARLFAQEGAKVIALDLKLDNAQQTVAGSPGGGICLLNLAAAEEQAIAAGQSALLSGEVDQVGDQTGYRCFAPGAGHTD